MNNYQIGGSLRWNDPNYVRRQADLDLDRALSTGQFCYIFNARQMGKSSLMVRAFHQLQDLGVACAAIDLSRIGSQNVTLEQWYKGLAVELWQAFDLVQSVNLKTWWQERQDLSPVQRLGQWIETVLLVEVKTADRSRPNLVIFLDEVDSVCSLEFSMQDFFALIRACYNRRSLDPEYQRLTFALLGVARPSDLITDSQRTPFNIGTAIALDGFQLSEAQPLAQGLTDAVNNPQLALEEILTWTGGQPFLTQKLCRFVVEQSRSTSDDRSHITEIVQQFILQSWEFQDEPEHLRTIRDRLLSNPERSIKRLGLYQQVLDTVVPFDGSDEQIELLLSGLVSNQRGQLVVKNPIYRAIFHRDWVSQQLSYLRPYAPLCETWIASGKQETACLLRGESLQDALAWALGKSLADQDYQFLGASQELAKREAQLALEAVEQANHILAGARQKANQEVPKQRIRFRCIPKVAIAVTAPVLLLRILGFLQGWELNLFDQFLRWRPVESRDERIAIVTIEESDLKQFGYPIPDRVLAQTINIIKAQKPRAIGLDNYRDLPVEPGHQDLVQVFQSTPNLFGIEKVVGSRVAAPPTLRRLQQVGFSDQVEDSDGTVRRALLSILSDNNAQYSLATQLALRYLESDKITPESLDSEDQRLRLGKVIFDRLKHNSGGYVGAETGGYQILLNYRGTEANFATFSLQQVLKRQIPSESLRGRVVLIGTTAESVKDVFQTPYSDRWMGASQPMPGVVLHANIVSQLLSAALEGRPLIRPWSEPLESAWILVWAGIGALISWQFKSSIRLIVGIVFVSGGLVVGCYGALLLGWWLPVAPALLGLWGSAIALWLVTNKQLDHLRFQHTLILLLQAKQDYPTAGRIAIEYLKQSETKENQTAIEQQLKQHL
ncbi:CHASE2 domain-containing protein [Leptolyngbya sp. NIES-2104]|uniref:CHASE2 domain-containing protein n=1 Tax=Leptolyngbya sp. NIES-2104 TaxID=1552121 RepID=UPI0006EC5B59|nr:CHASE2 domain-containing protein [Leptolyngbya sp. NIES-2104]GAP94793.1 high-affnity carbon uptake protein Hat/HatR [Leptolyngbya sp. NIES-2104]